MKNDNIDMRDLNSRERENANNYDNSSEQKVDIGEPQGFGNKGQTSH